MRKKIPEIWGVVVNDEIQLISVGVGRNFAAKRYLGRHHSKKAWKSAYNRGARLVRFDVVAMTSNQLQKINTDK